MGDKFTVIYAAKEQETTFFVHHWLESCYESDLILNMVLQYIFFGAFFLIKTAKIIFVNFYLFLKKSFSLTRLSLEK